MSTRSTQKLILESALRLFNEEGTTPVSHSQIAIGAGIARSHLHYHFPSKREIVLSLFQQLAARMDAGWYDDHRNATLAHMAVMYVRYLRQILEYRFFYREMTALLRDDPLLALRYNQNREKRIAELARFFRELERVGALRNIEGHLETLVASTWILCDSWPNYLEIQGRELTLQSALEGYASVLTVLSPFLTSDSSTVLEEAETTIAQILEISQPPLLRTTGKAGDALSN